jgi:glyoxalase family protein
MVLDGVHHVTATTGDARANVAFYTGVLGLRLIAKTVNQDDTAHYHLFYGDEQASAGADLTFFEYRGARQGRPGDGMVHTIVHRVGSAQALDFWAARLADAGLDVARKQRALGFADPEGLRHQLVLDEASDELLKATHPQIPAEHALGGFAGVRAYASDPARSGALLEQLLGAVSIGADTWELRGERRGGFIAYDAPPSDAPTGVQGAGVVHHVAWGTTVAEHPRWQELLTGAAVPTSGIIDRHYFHSIYFREPAGVLFEIADDGPGFTVDGLSVEALGSKIILPPFLEPRREEIVARLTPLPAPRADW